MVLHSDPGVNLLMFSNLVKKDSGKKFVVSIWECVVWLLWEWRNAKVFRGEELSFDKVVEEIKARLWSWISTKVPRCHILSFADWIDNTLMILNNC